MSQHAPINHEYHFLDADGNPAGGQSWGQGYAIAWQNGPLGRGAERKPPNGAFVEDILSAAIERMEFYQRSKFACEDNAEALRNMYAARAALQRRTRERINREVEGTHAL